MSIKIMNLVWERAPYRANTLLTLLALADWSNDDGLSWPKLETIAKKSRQSVRSAQYALEQLIADDVLEIGGRAGGRGNQNQYQIRVQGLHRFQIEKGCKPRQERVQSTTEKGANGDSAIRKNRQEPSKNQKALSPKVLDRLERDRRTRFTEAAKSGLRDFEKYPREAWELT